MPEKKEYKEEFAVVEKLPAQEVRQVINEEEQKKYNLLTLEEALTKILEILGRIELRLK
jgi:hypothetical protein